MKLSESKLWNAAIELSNYAGEVFAASGRGSNSREAILGKAARVASCITLALEEPDAAERQSLYEEARSAMGALAARTHIAAANGYVTTEFSSGLRWKLRTLVDALDLQRYRECRKRLGRAA